MCLSRCLYLRGFKWRNRRWGLATVAGIRIVHVPRRVGQRAHSVPRGPGLLLPTGCGHLVPILDSRPRGPRGPESGSWLPKFPSSPSHRCQFFLTWFCMSYRSVLKTSDRVQPCRAFPEPATWEAERGRPQAHSASTSLHLYDLVAFHSPCLRRADMHERKKMFTRKCAQ